MRGIEYDPKKSDKNVIARSLHFGQAFEFNWETALYSEDTRNNYPEKRYIAIGYLEKRLHVICFTPINESVRIISFRKANSREVKRYEKTINK